ncbi:hypothetical protein ACFL43_06090 [Thermodesulfobacteriota bacterium]
MFIIETVALSLPPAVQLVCLGTAVVFCVIYILARRQGPLQTLVWMYLVVNYCIIIYDWRYVSGYAGTSLSIALVVLCITPILLSGRQLFAALAATGGIIFMIYSLEMRYSQQMIQPENAPFFLEERFVGIVFLGYGVAFLVYLAMRSYDLQQARIQSLNHSLETTNRCLEQRNAELERTPKRSKRSGDFYRYVRVYCPSNTLTKSFNLRKN